MPQNKLFFKFLVIDCLSFVFWSQNVFFSKTNLNKNSCVENESTCCGGSCSNETPSKKSCCDSEINDKKTNIMEKTVLQYSNREKLRDYAYASLYAISAILLSKVALSFLYSK